MDATVVVRATLCANPSGFQDVCVLLKLRTSPLLSRASLKSVGHITPSGGDLRDFTRKATSGEFNLGPMIMASTRANAGPDMKTA
ncbi:replication initiation protein RepC [Shinella lacus]|uniref:replication initiation protein RepC n=1 Tax=Shinella lacus TaxID=2654216 RepID=UPI0034E21682